MHAYWENAAGTALQLFERNTGADTGLNLAIPEYYFIMPMPQRQLMCTTLTRQVDWGRWQSALLSCQNKLFAHCNCQRTADRLVACGSPPAAREVTVK